MQTKGAWHRVFVSLGSNIEPGENLPRALRLLAERCRLLRTSAVYETEPVGSAAAPRFHNAAALLETPLEPEDLKHGVLRVIERELGRVRSADRNAPRPIDLDIALFDARVRDGGDGGLELPDPDILRFAHVALPLAEIAPDERHPVTGERLADIARRLGPGAGIHRLPGT